MAEAELRKSAYQNAYKKAHGEGSHGEGEYEDD
jgi:hypothetical protein